MRGSTGRLQARHDQLVEHYGSVSAESALSLLAWKQAELEEMYERARNARHALRLSVRALKNGDPSAASRAIAVAAKRLDGRSAP